MSSRRSSEPGRAPVARAHRPSAARVRERERLGRLIGTIEAEIVPRLLMVLSAGGALREIPDATDVDELARLLLRHEAQFASAFVATLRAQGAPLNRICLQLFAPAARRLATLWEQGECDFEQLKTGLDRLYIVLQRCSGADH